MIDSEDFYPESCCPCPLTPAFSMFLPQIEDLCSLFGFPKRHQFLSEGD